MNFPSSSEHDITMNVLVTPLEDTLVEGTESYILSIAVTSGPAIVGALDTVTVNIRDNDGKLQFTNSVLTALINESHS